VEGVDEPVTERPVKGEALVDDKVVQ